MRRVLCGALAAGLMLCATAISGAQTVQKKKAPPKSAAKKAPVSASHTPSTLHTPSKSGTRPSSVRRYASNRNGKKGTPTRTTWRNRQLAPTPERYKEIQQALVAKGYLKPEDVSGGWDQNSQDALKKFQSAQNIDSNGKINSLSLIALGLGPKRDTASVKPATEPAQTDR
jgi:putative peptidoglycan binding protein